MYILFFKLILCYKKEQINFLLRLNELVAEIHEHRGGTYGNK